MCITYKIQLINDLAVEPIDDQKSSTEYTANTPSENEVKAAVC